MALTNKPSCIWFDLDDTLITTSESLMAAIRASKACLQEAYPDLTEREIARHSMDVWLSELGPGTSGFANLSQMPLSAFRSHIAGSTLKRMGIDGFDTDALIQCSSSAEEMAWKCYPGVIQLLDDLQNEGIPLGLISNGPTALQNHKLATCHLHKYFEHILLDCEVGISKPDRRIFDAASALMPRFDNVMIGNDPDADINGALRSNWMAYWFVPGWDGETTPAEMGYISIHHHRELLQHLTKR
jgi:putative hydrolase of the HAD superfamily